MSKKRVISSNFVAFPDYINFTKSVEEDTQFYEMWYKPGLAAQN